jgi:hypothetical protein
VRTDNLETDERIYRVPPGQAMEILALIQNTPGADHPKGSKDRKSQGEMLEAIAIRSDLISRQTKHGR